MTRSATAWLLILFLASLASAQEREIDPNDEARARFLLDEYLLRADDRRARAIEKELAGLEGLDLDRLTRLLHEPMPRPARTGGIERRTLTLGGEQQDYRCVVFVPEGYDPKIPYPLLLTAHGTGGEEEGPFEAMLPHARGAGMILASLGECAKRRDKGWAYSDEERRVQEEFILLLRQDYQIDPRRIYMNGWSRGGHASWDLALRRPGLLAGIGPIVGGVPARDLVLLPNLLGCRIDAVNGGRDQPELVTAVREAAARLTALGADYRGYLDPERGHAVFEDRLAGMVAHLAAHSRPLAPARVAIASYEKELVRHDWLAIAGFEAKLYRPGARIVIPGVTKMSPEEQRAAWLEAVAEGTARLEGRVESGNLIVLDAHKVKRVRILLPPTGIDLEKPVEIRLGERSLRRSRFRPSMRDLLRSARELRDPFMAYPVRVELSLP